MAKNFLEESSTYVKKTDPEIRTRRAAIMKHLNDSYKAGRGSEEAVFKKVRNELQAQGIELNKSKWQADKSLIRAAYRFLTAKTQFEREEVEATNKGASAMGIRCLKKDGIFSWDDLKKKAEPKSVPKPEEQPPQEMPSPATALRFQLGTVNELVESVLHENQILAEENRNTTSAYRSLQEDIEILIRRLEEARLQLSAAHATSLERLADLHPEILELRTVILKLRGEVEVVNGSFDDLKERLPQKFVFKSEVGAMVYEKTFLREVAALQKQDQERIFKAMEMLSHNPNHPSLQTKKTYGSRPHTPPASFQCRATDELRFTWRKAPGRIIIYFAWRKGDTRVSDTES